MAMLQPGDTLVVWKLDRLSRSLSDLIDKVRSIEDQGAHIASLCEALDTNSAGGRLVFHFFGALADFERELIRERVLAGIAAAQDAGTHCGRPQRLTPELAAQAQILLNAGQSPRQVAAALQCSHSTIYLALKAGILDRSGR